MSLQLEIGEFQNICMKNPVFPECQFIERIERKIPEWEEQVGKGEVTYRARVYSENIMEKIMQITENAHRESDYESIKNAQDKSKKVLEKRKRQKDNGFLGYDEANSFVPPNWRSIQAGRCNHDYECCLYVAQDIETAISELKPLIGERISVAKVEVCQELRLIDLSINYKQKEEIKNIVGAFFLISPTEYNKNAYIYTQVICSIVKKLGYDGVIYTSCQNREKKNYAIFNYNKCKVISSEVYSVTGIKYDIIKQNVI